MNSDLIDCIESDEIILSFDVPDVALERAGAESPGQGVTWMYCTHVWYNCGWPQ
jgi:hypothetical protein